MESSTYRRIETTGAKANLAKLRALKNDMEGVIKNFETRFLAEFQNNYDSERAQQLHHAPPRGQRGDWSRRPGRQQLQRLSQLTRHPAAIRDRRRGTYDVPPEERRPHPLAGRRRLRRERSRQPLHPLAPHDTRLRAACRADPRRHHGPVPGRPAAAWWPYL